MTTCQDARAALLLRELGTIEQDAAIALHLQSCGRCAGEMARVRTATEAAAAVMNGWTSIAEPMALAEQSIGAAVAWRAERKQRGRRLLVGIGALAITAWVLMVSQATAGLRARLGFPDPPYTITVTLQCVAPELAAQVASAHLHSPGSRVTPGNNGAPVVTLSGRREEVAQAEIEVATLDGRLGPAPPAHCVR